LTEESATPEELEQKVHDILDDMMRGTATFKALEKYRPLVRNLSVEEYAGLRAAVEEDRIRRIAQMYAKYPWLMEKRT
jgi:hypothetical protein